MDDLGYAVPTQQMSAPAFDIWNHRQLWLTPSGEGLWFIGWQTWNMVWTRLIHLDPPSTHTIHKMKFYHVLPHNFSTLTILCGYLEGLGARFSRHFRRTMLDGRILRVIFQRVKRTWEDPITWHWKQSSSAILDVTRLLLSDSSITFNNYYYYTTIDY
jgi:hypothetical protein